MTGFAIFLIGLGVCLYFFAQAKHAEQQGRRGRGE
jgi:hypothetical protein